MIKLGDYNTLRVDHAAEQGLYLQGDEQTGDILLPKRSVPRGVTIGDEIEVFIYLDQDERIIATTEHPIAKVGEFAWLEVAWINKYGAFMKWGLMKDLFCPFREQKKRMEVGKHYIVYIKEDEETHRLMATAKVDRFLLPAVPNPTERSQQPAVPNPTERSQQPAPSTTASGSAQAAAQPQLTHGQPCDCLIWQKTDLGFKCIVDNKYQGQIYDNQIFQPLHAGNRLTAYIDHIRQDGKIDITLQPTGHRHTLDFAEVLLRYLYENNGRCDLGDKSPAELIYDRFKVSKKAYKKAVGDLYRRRLITVADESISLV